jgi:DNA-binding CsgD family transcriptional regulator
MLTDDATIRLSHRPSSFGVATAGQRWRTITAPLPLEHVPPSGPGAGSAPPEQLTERETAILQLLAVQLSAREIAVLLGIPSATVDRQLSAISRKLSIGTRRPAVDGAHDSGAVPRDRERVAASTSAAGARLSTTSLSPRVPLGMPGTMLPGTA